MAKSIDQLWGELQQIQFDESNSYHANSISGIKVHIAIRS
jgi:hypothetical protein